MASGDPAMTDEVSIMTKLTRQCILRIEKDLKEVFDEKPPGWYVLQDKKDISVVHALLIGPADTPYEKGFFYFLVCFPSNFPNRPPHVKLMTTGESKVRFNETIYANGKVRLSILGNFVNPCWNSTLSFRNVLDSIQSLLNENPYFNALESEEEMNPGESAWYNQIMKHETLRVAVCDMLEGTTSDSRNLPKSLRRVIEKHFLEFYEYYENTSKANMNLNQRAMEDPLYGAPRGNFNYSSILKRLQEIKGKLESKWNKT